MSVVKRLSFFLKVFVFSGLVFLISLIGLIILTYWQLPQTKIYYFYTQWDRFKNLKHQSFTYQMPMLSREYVSQFGDSFWSIAKRFNLNIDTVVSFNEVGKVHVIPLGFKMIIPFKDGILYRRDHNQSLDEIANQYHIPSEKILFFNPHFLNRTNVFLPDAFYDLEIRLGKLGSEFFKPLPNIFITSLYGLRIHPITKKRQFHYGVDIRGRYGETVFSAMGGRVIFSGNSASFGHLVVIRHKKGYISKYAHLSKTLVKNGQQVSSQHPIGKIGNTGLSTGTHLHFEIWKNGRPIDPRDVTDFY